MSSTPSKGFLNPYVGGVLLGLTLFTAYALTGGGIGASGAINRCAIGSLKALWPGHVDRVQYLAHTGGGSRRPFDDPSVWMLVGTFLGGALSGAWQGRFKVQLFKGPRIGSRTRLALAFVGGAVMGYGARMARGCTSGQALSGGAVLSVGSFAFMFSIFIGGYAVAYLFRRLWT